MRNVLRMGLCRTKKFVGHVKGRNVLVVARGGSVKIRSDQGKPAQYRDYHIDFLKLGYNETLHSLDLSS